MLISVCGTIGLSFAAGIRSVLDTNRGETTSRQRPLLRLPALANLDTGIGRGTPTGSVAYLVPATVKGRSWRRRLSIVDLRDIG
jgi:hypothetical protein